MQFHYVAYNIDEGLVKGLIEAGNEAEVRSEVVRKGYKPLRVQPSRQLPSMEELFPSFYRVGKKQLIAFLRHLATMVGSGASLQRTLEMLQAESGNRLMRRVLGRVRAAVDEGSTLSSALAEHPDVFNPLLVSVVEVGEFTGQLAPALEQLADIMEKEQEAKQRVMRTMMMPMINLVAAGLMLVIMMTVVLPPIFDTFENDTDIPLMMRIAMGISNLIMDNALFFLVGGIMAFVMFKLLGRMPSVSYALDAMKAAIPVFGPLTIAVELSGFSRTVGMMLGSGVPFADALHLGTNGVKNLLLRRAFVEAEDSLLSGHSVTEALKRHPVIPNMWVELVMIGEQSNSLGRAMNDLADAYQKQSENQLSGLLAVLEPASTLVVGGGCRLPGHGKRPDGPIFPEFARSLTVNLQM